MKRILVLLTMIFLMTPLFAVTYTLSNQTGSIPLNGFINEYVILRVDPISADGNSATGMPFDITAADIDYSSTVQFQGRKIADWSFATNCSSAFLIITAGPLVNNEADTPESVNYYMTFSYKYTTVDVNENDITYIGYMEVNSVDSSVSLSSGNEDFISYNPSNNTISILADGRPVISMDCDIRIRLHSYTSEQKEDWPVGYYYGTVQFEFSGE